MAPSSQEANDAAKDDQFDDIQMLDDDALAADATESGDAHHSQNGNDNTPKLKRTACTLCRKRKLKCDGARPKCATCARLNHECHYDEVRKKSGPKRGYVKALESRLADVEARLKTAQDPPANNTTSAPPETFANLNGTTPPNPQFTTGDSPLFNESPYNSSTQAAQTNLPQDDISWDMISLGLEEPLPDQDVINELTEIYFTKVHSVSPVLHRARFFASMDRAPHMRPPIGLRYVMWTCAASVSDKYHHLHEHFYRRARKYLELDEMRGMGETIINLYHCQAWALMAFEEFKCMYFPRAWMSTGRACRLVQMLGLNRVDGTGLEVKQCLPPPKDWTEKEERRRTFWVAFWADRCASVGTGWPMSLDEQDIRTNLPCSEDAYQNCRPEQGLSLDEALASPGSSNLSSFGAGALLCAIFGRNLIHLHRPSPEDCDDDINGAFWQRHRDIDATVLSLSMNLPDHLRLHQGLYDPNIIFTNMCIHTSTICLHQAAIFKADKNQLPNHISGESKVRCITAAAEIAGIMRAISHMDFTTLNPFMSFCLYVAARVFVQYLKARRNDQQIIASLKFVLSAMGALKKKNPLTESFLAQVEIDLESAGLSDLIQIGSVQEAFIEKLPLQFRHMRQPCAPGVLPQNSSVEQRMQDTPGYVTNTYSTGIKIAPAFQRFNTEESPSSGNQQYRSFSDAGSDAARGVSDRLGTALGTLSSTDENGFSGSNSEMTSPNPFASAGSSGTGITLPSDNSGDRSNRQTQSPFDAPQPVIAADGSAIYDFNSMNGQPTPAFNPNDLQYTLSDPQQQEFTNFAKQFFPPTPSSTGAFPMPNDFVISNGTTGMTPMASAMEAEDWNSLFEDPSWAEAVGAGNL